MLHSLPTIADIDLICSIIYGSNVGEMLHSLARIADIDLIGSVIYGSNMGDMCILKLQLLILTSLVLLFMVQYG